jgi:hypothetical protein
MFSNALRAVIGVLSGQKLIMSRIVRFTTRGGARPGDQPRIIGRMLLALGQVGLAASRGSTEAGRTLLKVLARRGEVAVHDLGLRVVGA